MASISSKSKKRQNGRAYKLWSVAFLKEMYPSVSKFVLHTIIRECRYNGILGRGAPIWYDRQWKETRK